MNSSPTIAELAKALNKAQAEFKSAKKSADNPFFKSKYADMAAVHDATQEALTANGLAVVQTTKVPEGAGVIVTTTLLHTSGEWISGDLFMTPVKNDPQGIGSCISYARRYGKQAILDLVTEDDDGNGASGKTDKKEEPKADPETLKALAKAAEKGREAFYKAWADTPQDKRKTISQSAMADLKAKVDEAETASA